MNRKPNPTPAPGEHPFPHVAGVCIFLVAITFVVFGRTLHYDFVNLDDDLIIFQNPHITGGFSLKAVAWIFTHFDANFYIPLTAISHMIDCSLFGLRAGGHHFTNVILHALSSVLLFTALRRMTGALWRSAFVAALFAIHPLHVESGAWVSERKDLLGGLFFMLVLLAYERYVRHLRAPGSTTRYLAVIALFFAGLLCKPTLVPLPFVLLLLDYWPLRRFPISRQLILEKIPLFALSTAASVVAVFAEGSAVMPLGKFPLSLRIGNAIVSTAIYIVQMIEPVNLEVFYPFAGNTIPLWKVLLAAALLVSITAGVWRFRQERPYLIAGWFWYLAVLAPVSGIVQIGIFAHADRCTYLAYTGLFVIVAWGVGGLFPKMQRRRLVAGCAMGFVIADMMFCAAGQASWWKDSETLWTHTLDIDPGNSMAANSLGEVMLGEGRTTEALEQFNTAVTSRPDYAEARNNLGAALFQQGRVDEAVAQFRKAVEIDPSMAEAHDSLANALFQQGKLDEAAAQYRQALALKPHLASALNNLAWLLATAPAAPLRDGPQAVALAGEAATLQEGPVALHTLAAAYAAAGRFSEAVETGRKALALAEAQSNTGLAENLREEIKLYEARGQIREPSGVSAAPSR